MKRTQAAILSAVLFPCNGCLPDETRAPPAAVLVSVAAATPADQSFESVDGWALSLQNTYANLGDVELEGDDCEVYSDAHYSRLLNLASTEPQRLSLLYGLGSCSLSFAISDPDWDTVLGDGLPLEAAERFRTPGSDGETDGGVSLYVDGRAQRGEVVVSFAWAFRARLGFRDCRRHDETSSLLALMSDGAQGIALEIDTLGLFRDEAGELHFDPFAAADDLSEAPDGELTLEELKAAAGAEPSETLFHELYYRRLPRLARVADGACAGRVETCDHDCRD